MHVVCVQVCYDYYAGKGKDITGNDACFPWDYNDRDELVFQVGSNSAVQ